MGRALVSVRDVRELKAVVLAFSRLPNDIKRTIAQQTRLHANPIWQGEVTGRLRTAMDKKTVGAGVRVKAGNPIVMQAAQSTRAIGGRLKPSEDWQGWEFGTDAKDKTSTYERRSKNGGTHTVTRHASKAMPPRYRNGRIAYPSFAETAPRLASLWVKTVVRAIHEAAEARG